MIWQDDQRAEAKPQPKRKAEETQTEPPADDEAEVEKKEEAQGDNNVWVMTKGDDNKDWVVAKKDQWHAAKKDKGYGKGTSWTPQAMVWCRECQKKTYVARSSPLRKQGLRWCQNHLCLRWQHYKPADDNSTVISTGNKTPSIHSIPDDEDDKPDELTGSLEDHDSNAYWDSFFPDEDAADNDDKPDEDETPRRLRIRKKSPDDRKNQKKGQMLFCCNM